MSEYKLTLLAEQDLEGIYDHIAERNPDAAFRVIQAIEKRSEALADMPNTGKKRDEYFKSVRSVAEGNYVVFFKKIPEGILVIRVVHSKRDMDQFFAPDAIPPELSD